MAIMKKFLRELFCIHDYKGMFLWRPHRFWMKCKKCGKEETFL